MSKLKKTNSFFETTMQKLDLRLKIQFFNYLPLYYINRGRKDL